MSKEKILLDLITKLLTKEYVLSEVRRSNSNDKQEYDFVIKKASSRGDLNVKKPMTKEEYERMIKRGGKQKWNNLH